MSYILLPSLITLISIVCESLIRKQKHYPIFYVRIFAILLGLELLLTSSYVKSEELETIGGYEFEITEMENINQWLVPDISDELNLLKQLPIGALTANQGRQEGS